VGLRWHLADNLGNAGGVEVNGTYTAPSASIHGNPVTTRLTEGRGPRCHPRSSLRRAAPRSLQEPLASGAEGQGKRHNVPASPDECFAWYTPDLGKTW